ncbi:hypothetical protein AND4_01278 [Vibrio sp. AND4]|nr:hypothetical protein AND4_01278 [Vibrio sp. AND4]
MKAFRSYAIERKFGLAVFVDVKTPDFLVVRLERTCVINGKFIV